MNGLTKSSHSHNFLLSNVVFSEFFTYFLGGSPIWLIYHINGIIPIFVSCESYQTGFKIYLIYPQLALWRSEAEMKLLIFSSFHLLDATRVG